MNKPKVVVLGAGYGGLMTVTRLVKKIGINEADITLVNKHNYHYETTWMHEASAGTLHHDRCRYPIKDVINTSRVRFVQDTVKNINKEEKRSSWEPVRLHTTTSSSHWELSLRPSEFPD